MVALTSSPYLQPGAALESISTSLPDLQLKYLMQAFGHGSPFIYHLPLLKVS